MTRDGVDQAIDECRRLRGRRFDRRPVRSRASFLGLRHAFFPLNAAAYRAMPLAAQAAGRRGQPTATRCLVFQDR